MSLPAGGLFYWISDGLWRMTLGPLESTTMADEVNAVVGNDPTEEQKPVNAEEPEVAANPDEGGDTDPQATPEQGETEHKRKGGWQRKQEKAERERDLALEEKEYWRQQALRLTPQEKVEEVKPSVPQKPNKDTFEGDLDAYIEAVAEWKAEVAFQAREQRQAEAKAKEAEKTEAQKLAEAWNTHVEKAREAHPDFDEILEVPVFPQDPAKRQFMQRELMKSDVAGELAYYLGSHPEEARKIADMDTTSIARAFGRLEAQFAKSETAETKETVPPVTKAPKPPTPPSKSGPTVATVDPRSPESDKLTDEEWLKHRRAQIKRK